LRTAKSPRLTACGSTFRWLGLVRASNTTLHWLSVLKPIPRRVAQHSRAIQAAYEDRQTRYCVTFLRMENQNMIQKRTAHQIADVLIEALPYINALKVKPSWLNSAVTPWLMKSSNTASHGHRADETGRLEPDWWFTAAAANRPVAGKTGQNHGLCRWHAHHRQRDHGRVEMVLGGLVNKEIVNLINMHGGKPSV